MFVVLPLGVLILTVVAGWMAHRRHEASAWDRELEVAFGAGDRIEISHRAL